MGYWGIMDAVVQPARRLRSRTAVTAKGSGVKRNRSGRITRTKILDAAEQVFADKGINGASLREIMIVAEVNIAAVNYYFGSKADLLKAVVSRRSALINGARLSLLEEGVHKSGSVPTIDDWLHAFVQPFVEAEGSSESGWRNFMRVLNWVATGQGQDKLCQEIIQETYGAMRQSFLDALALIMPELSVEEVNWRYYSAVTVLRTVVIARERAELAGAPVNTADLNHMMAHVVPFLRGGLTAPAMARDK
jgi:AcrR family transcriptional regulator